MAFVTMGQRPGYLEEALLIRHEPQRSLGGGKNTNKVFGYLHVTCFTCLRNFGNLM